MDDGVANMRKLLDNEASGFWLAVARGMGGIGKITPVNLIFNQLSSHFGMCSSFSDDIQEKVIKRRRNSQIAENVIVGYCKSSAVTNIDNVDYGEQRIGETLLKRKVPIVLDDVDESEQV
ncbi:hypothetical protein ACJRO7_000137 [Eucalyptus globulus]|uniref:NB-ARC domain-containing protein n=1 Tax=Eucalyptus globulus TaxID=34317 RepID=A0ABD3LMK0_EUCGL